MKESRLQSQPVPSSTVKCTASDERIQGQPGYPATCAMREGRVAFDISDPQCVTMETIHKGGPRAQEYVWRLENPFRTFRGNIIIKVVTGQIKLQYTLLSEISCLFFTLC